MESATWAVPTEKILDREPMEKVIGIMWRMDKLCGLAASVAATTALRLSEVYHIRAEDVLPGGRLRITRRKKKILKPEIIEVSAALVPHLEAQKATVKAGWLFPGGSKPCEIVRRPEFKEYRCPDCNRHIANPRTHKTSKDLKQAFVAHLTDVHQRDADEVVEWIDLNSESRREVPVGCTGGHISGRHIQTTWKFATAEAGVIMHGRGFHTTRHHAITRYVEEHPGENPKEAQMFAGHSSLEMTMRYTHPKELGKKVRAMGAVGV